LFVCICIKKIINVILILLLYAVYVGRKESGIGKLTALGAAGGRLNRLKLLIKNIQNNA